jgi:radical SAM protein with 4Fe4S-binding SPASM domain
MSWIYEKSHIAPFVVATTEAPSYRRVALERMRLEGLTAGQIKGSSAYRGFGIRHGHGIVFVSHTGEICPAGFLPLVVGNTRRDHVAEVYRSAPVFKALHNPTTFEGRCGCCQYQMVCGGSRARAFEATGNALASDAFCTHEPKLPAI